MYYIILRIREFFVKHILDKWLLITEIYRLIRKMQNISIKKKGGIVYG